MRALSWLHKMIGLCLGLWLMAMGATGAILSFYSEIDEALNAKDMRVARVVDRPDVETMAAAVRHAYPDRTLLMMDRYGIHHDESWPFVLGGSGTAAAEPSLEVFVDPASQTILGTRPYWTTFRLIRSFHMELLTPPKGAYLVGVAGAALLIMVVAGVAMWWRENRRRIGKALRPRLTGPRPLVYRNLHLAGGIYAALFLAIQGTSGALAADLFPAKMLMASLFPSGPPMMMPMATGHDTLGANRARDIALAMHPAADVVQITFPSAFMNSYSVRLFPRDQPKTRYTRQYMIDAQSGQVVFAFDPAKQSAMDRFFGAWMIWIHNGRFFGTIGQIVLVLAGSVLTLLFPTGVYLWWRKREARRRSRETAAARA